MKLIQNLVQGHKHSPGDAAQGEDYPAHLSTSISNYNKLMEGVEENPPTVSQENYKVQRTIVGITSPIGNDTNANTRTSTRGENAKLGINLVERDKTSMPYISPYAGIENDKSPKSTSKKPKFNVKDIISSTNQCRSDMSSAIIDLASSAKKGSTSSEEISFKKGMWEDKKQYMDRKLEEKYSYRKSKSRLQNTKMILDILKRDRDDTIIKYKEEEDKDLKMLYKNDYKNFASLYSNKLKQFVSQSSERDDTQTVCSASSDSVRIMERSTQKRKYND